MSLARKPIRNRPTLILLITLIVLFLLWFSPVIYPESILHSSLAYESKNAIVTFLNNEPETDGIDYHYITTRILAYQTLHAEATKCRKRTPFVVIVTPDVSEDKCKQLTSDGALVIEPEDVILPSWIPTERELWKSHFTKLRAFQMTEYERIVMLEANHVLTRPLDDLFDDPAASIPQNTTISKEGAQDDLEGLPEQYSFAARTSNEWNGNREHPVPPKSGDSLSASFWVAAPSFTLHDYLASLLSQHRRFNVQRAEHDLFNHAFRRDGPMPWRELNYTWATNWSNEADFNASIAAIHDRFWLGISPRKLQDLWLKLKDEMEAYFDGEKR